MTSKILVYVDPNLAVQVATSLIGSKVAISDETTKSTGVNFRIVMSNESRKGTTRETNVRDLLPEHLVDHIIVKIPDRFDSLRKIGGKLSAGHEGSYYPGNTIAVEGVLELPSQPSGIGQIWGETCLSSTLNSDNLTLPVYFPADSIHDIEEWKSQPIEVLGVLKWCRPYSPGGGAAWNLAMRAVALWLR